MTQTLPASIAAYFDAANCRDFDRATAQFSADARVRDESRDHIGRAAIENWLKQTVDTYDFHADPGPAEHRMVPSLCRPRCPAASRAARLL